MDTAFFDLQIKRKNWVQSSEENKFDFDSILTGLYTDPSHFIYELLQNAEDEGAEEVRFKLFEDRLDFYHNGQEFDIADIEGITGIGISKKKEDLIAIGKFGVGFKSVFAITRNPEIYSGDYNFRIENFVVPEPINRDNVILESNETLIRLPFNHNRRNREEIFNLISNRLQELDPKTILFLKNIKEIQWETPFSNGEYSKERNNIQGKPNVNRVKLKSSRVTEEYLVIEKIMKIEDKELRVEIAFKLGIDQNGNEMITPEPNSKLVVFFPTEKVTFLNFLIQGPFKTTPNRENIPLSDEQNKKILEEIVNLVAESLNIMKELGYLNTDFLKILPLKSYIAKQEQIYSEIYNKVKEKLLSEELLPTSDGRYTKATDALLARGKELTEFLNNEDIRLLFSKQHWLDSNITQDRTPELREYLIKELTVQEVDFESFARKITAEFLQTKTDEWLIDFYRRLLDQQALWSDRVYSKGVLRTKPIMRLENGEHIAPFDSNGKVQVYLPTETKSKYKTVKRIFIENEESLKFLKELGLTKPDIFAEIREFILPKYRKENPIKDESYFEDFEKLLKGYEIIASNKKEEFVRELSNANFVYADKNDETKNSCLLKATQIYFPDQDLKTYFEGYPSVYFVSEELFKEFEVERVRKFLKELGVEDKPRRLEIDVNLSWEEKSRLRGNSGCRYDIHQKDYEYEGLGNFINSITPEKSYLLWKLLLKSIESLNSRLAQGFFEGEYRWFYYSQHSRSFEAKFLKTLKQQAWLVDKNNNFKKPSEITFSELSDGYIKNGSNIDILIKALEFRPEIFEQLPEDYRKKLEIVKDIPIEELEKLISERKEKPLEQEKEEWKPEFEPEQITPTIEEIEPDKIETANLSSQTEDDKTGIDKTTIEVEIEKKEKIEKEEEISIDKKTIGKWGEKFVYYALRGRYEEKGKVIEAGSGFKVVNDDDEELVEIIWLNKEKDVGKGYDFVVKESGTEIEYIEVKTKTKENEELIEVTGTQWEWARQLFEKGEGEKYSFYVVYKAGTREANIKILKNPVKLWKEGKLYAHPVKVKL
ncbi:MAG: DUF3883 domain-containing protein [Ignavibacteria bacterium]|nr:DUF3883 domain-containing protein [Ignavibacteria bacterium]